MTSNELLSLEKEKNDLEIFSCKKWNEWNAYVDKKMEGKPVPLTSSVDIRESKYKVAPVDLNIYPAGFNNICQLDRESGAYTLKKSILTLQANTKVVGLVCESHTKNLFYLDHLHYLKDMMETAGFNVFVISFDQNLFPESIQHLALSSHSGFSIEIFHASVNQTTGKIFSSNQEKISTIDFILMNHDQSIPLNIDWQQLTIPVHPSPLIGWFQRQKARHFEFYHQVIQDFGKHFSINPSILEAKFKAVYNLDFEHKSGIETLAAAVDELKSELTPDQSIFVKAGQGTYGMGINVVKSGEDILNMNRKTRNKMDVGKSGLKFSSAVIQESIETTLFYDGHPAEITIYLVGGKSIGGFMRTNLEKDVNSNLNSKGMVFQKFCISEIRANQEHKTKECLYSLLARLSTLAGAYEIEEIQQLSKKR